ncbi:Phosphoribosylformylglycinamidine synthase, partial [human gut metagenome]
LAMTLADLQMIRQQYAKVEHRDPTITEIRLFDTYWSDHCRHTTFMTELTDITIEDSRFAGINRVNVVGLDGIFLFFCKGAFDSIYASTTHDVA